jgi:hypothetical protein
MPKCTPKKAGKTVKTADWSERLRNPLPKGEGTCDTPAQVGEPLSLRVQASANVNSPVRCVAHARALECPDGLLRR